MQDAELHDRQPAIQAGEAALSASLLVEGFDAQRQGDLARAEMLYRRALEENPSDTDTIYLLGYLHHQQGDDERALPLILEAVAQRPQEALFLKGLGDVFRSSGQRDRARECLLRASLLNQSFVDPLIALGEIAAADGNVQDAVGWFRRAVDADPQSAQAYVGLGCALRDLGNLDGAERCLSIAVSLRPESAEAVAFLGEVAMKQGRFPDAEARFRKSLELRPFSPQVLNNLGSALKEQGKAAEAIPWYLAAMDRAPGEASVAFNIGGAHSALGNRAEAIRWYDRATELNPDYAEAHANKALLLLAAAEFERGWVEYEWRFKIKDGRQKIDTRTFPAPMWDGSPFPEKTLLVRSEQGAGDMIQFSRYLPFARALGGRVILETGQRIRRLLRNVRGADGIVTISETPGTPFDYWIPLLSLPKFFTHSIAEIPASQSYLQPEQELVVLMEKRINKREFSVGLCWQGNREYIGDKDRSMAFNALEPLFGLPGVRYYSLQKGYGAEQLLESPYASSVADLAATLDVGGDAFVDTAAAMAHLDLVITIDTAVAHLAGALGRPVWLLLSENPEWRWFQGTEDTPWYPTMRLFRRRSGEGWNGLMGRVSRELAEVVRSPRPARSNVLQGG